MSKYLDNMGVTYLWTKIKSYVSGVLASFAPLNSPVFTGVPTAPTAGSGTNNTQIATTAFVQSAIPQADWNETDSSSKAFIQNKPTIPSEPEGSKLLRANKSIAAGTDLDALGVGEYYATIANARTCINTPWGDASSDAYGFRLTVEKTTNTASETNIQFRQTLFPINDVEGYTRVTYSTSAINYTEWREIYQDSNHSILTQGNWHYRVYKNNTFEAWYGATGQTVTVTTKSGTLYRSDRLTLTLPTNMTNNKTTSIISCEVFSGHNNYPVWASIASNTATTVNYYILSGASRSQNSNYTISAYAFGTIE